MISRRNFFGAAAVGGAVRGANDRIRFGIIGSGDRGCRLLQSARLLPDVSLVAVCDIYDAHLKRGMEFAAPGAAAGRDYRRVTERKDVDAVIVATPNHWHARIAEAALEAGKDVYLEKPMTHRLEEGRRLIAAAKKTKRVVQIGHNRRSRAVYQKAREIVASGMLGPVTFVRLAWFRNTTEPQWRRPVPRDASPQSIDWDRFVEPAERRPFDPQRFFSWYCYWDYCGGIAADLLVHSVDTMNLILGSRQPDRVAADGDILYWKDGRDVPDTFSAIFHYAEGFQVNFSCTFANQQPGTRDAFYGKDGTVEIVDLSKLYFYAEPIAKVRRPDLFVSNAVLEPRDSTDLHVRNFFECVRSRAATRCTVEDGENSAVACHLANRALREGRLIRWDRTAGVVS